MKKSQNYISVSLIFLMMNFSAFAQKNSCCSKPADNTQTFAMLGSNSKFINAHEAPLPFNYESENGKIITFNTPDKLTVTAFEIKAEKPTNNYLFVIHEWWGLNDYIKQEAEKFQKELGNVNVIALDLYEGKTAANADDAGKFMQAVKEERAKAIIAGAINYVGANAKIATVGWCFGGGWSLQASILAGKQGAGCIMYYGMPEKEISKLNLLKGDVLGIFATKDQWINANVVTTFENDMKSANKKLTIKKYDADHAFANPSNPHFNKECANDAHQLAIAFLKERFK